MRGLNLSRLAKASEGSFFKDQQTAQAARIRQTLSRDEVASLKSAPPPEPPTVDTLSSISAQSAYRKLVRASAPLPTAAAASPLATRLKHAPAVAHPSASRSHLDPAMMRTLGTGKLSMLSDLRRAPSRPLPGSEKYAEGAVLGMTSFSVATAIVSAVGLGAVLVVYFNPGVIDGMRERTRRFSRRVDRGIGERLRRRVEKVRDRGPVMSDERKERVGRMLAGAVGVRRSAERLAAGDEDSGAGGREEETAD